VETNRIASYTLQREIGSGGMSTVYLAENSIGDRFAIKTLHLDLIQHESIRKRFRNEMEALKSLRDIEQVCQIKDFYEDGQQMAIVMEYLTGNDLLRFIRLNGPVAPQQLIGWMQVLLPAFVICHARKIVHRDVKPSNFFLTDDGKLKILDFGIAKALEQNAAPVNSMTLGLTQFQEVIGSPMYMSPEQVRGVALIDHRSDIYSLGVTIHTLLAGRNPYDGMNITSSFDMQDAVVNRALPPLGGALSAFDPIIQRATQKDPNARYQSVQTLLDELSALNAPPKKPITNRIVVQEDTLPPPAVQRQPPVRVAAAPPVAPVAVSGTKTSTNRNLTWILLIGAGVVALVAGYFLLRPATPTQAVRLTDAGEGRRSEAALSVRPVEGEPTPSDKEASVRQSIRQLTHLDDMPIGNQAAAFNAARESISALPREESNQLLLDSMYVVCSAEGARAIAAYTNTGDVRARQRAIEWYQTAYVLKPYPALQNRITRLQTETKTARNAPGLIVRSQSVPIPAAAPRRAPKSKPARKTAPKTRSPFVLDSEVNP